MVKVSLVQNMNSYRGSKGRALLFIQPRQQMAVYGQRHAQTDLSSGKRSGTHCRGGCLGPRAGLDRGKNSRLYRNSIPGPLACSESLYQAIPTHTHRRRSTKNLWPISLRVSFPVYSLMVEALTPNPAVGYYQEPAPSIFHPQKKKKKILLKSILILLSRFFGLTIYRFSARLSH